MYIPICRGGRKGGKQGPGPPLKYSAPVIYMESSGVFASDSLHFH